jgi:uncharacterized membrane-anchored protein YhcB (DUF1043 family)
MKTLKPWLVILLVFVAGFAGGIVATRATVRHYIHQALNRPEQARDMMEQRMVRRMQLDAEQRRKVHQILVRRQAELRGLRQEYGPRFFQIVSNADWEISAALTPEQRERFEEFREQNRRLLPPFGRRPPQPRP